MKAFLLVALIFSSNAFAAKVKKEKKQKAPVVEEKIYSVPQAKPEILIGNQAPLPERRLDLRPDRLYYAGLSVSGLTYKIPSLISNAPAFKQDLAGIILGRKTANTLFYYRGHFEIDGEWMRFKRSTSVFEQKLNLLQVDLIQNVDLAWSLKRSLFFSAGIGIAPVIILGEQSVFGNSFSHFGATGVLKLNFIVPVKNKFELDFGLKGQWGSAGGHELFLSGLNLGLNFE